MNSRATRILALFATNSKILTFSYLIVVVTFFSSGCSTLSLFESRRELANSLASRAGFTQELVKANPFVITTYHRINNAGKEGTVYIEGDGLAWLSRSRLSPNPTPKDPISLKLAAKDLSENVIYLARPCQYTPVDLNPICRDSEFWSGKRFSEEVVSSLNLTLNALKERNNVSGFHLVGYSGGGAVAVLIASRRTDVLSLSTIAGNLDPTAVNEYHNVTPLQGSLDPMDVAARLRNLPQHHFVGEDDKIVPPFISENFIEKMGKNSSAERTVMKGYTHKKGWVV